MANVRSRHFDIEAGVLLAYMVFTHISQWAGVQDSAVAVVLEKAFFFFMPFFFFKGGVFFKAGKSTLEVIRTGFRRLIVPFVVFTVMGHLLWCVHLALTGGLSLRSALVAPFVQVLKFGSAEGNLALWFLLSLFCVRVIFSLAVKRINAVVVFIVCAAVSAAFNAANLALPCYCGNIPAGLMFFSMGYVLKDRQYHKWMVLVCILVYLSMFVMGWSVVDMRDNSLKYGWYVHWIFTSLAGIILLANILRLVERLAVFNPFAGMGRNSMYYYAVHWMVIVLTMIVYSDVLGYAADGAYFAVLAAACLTVLPCLVALSKRPAMNWAWGM